MVRKSKFSHHLGITDLELLQALEPQFYKVEPFQQQGGKSRHAALLTYICMPWPIPHHRTQHQEEDGGGGVGAGREYSLIMFSQENKHLDSQQVTRIFFFFKSVTCHPRSVIILSWVLAKIISESFHLLRWK